MSCRNKRVFVAAVGDANSPVTWSGIPYHLLKAGQAAGLIDEGLPLSAEGSAWQRRRFLWNGLRVFTHLDRPGGYQYSVSFLESLWAPVKQRVQNGLVLNCFQLYAPSVVADSSIEKWYFLDQTLTQLFDHYGLRSSVGRSIAKEALKRERAGYEAAAGIVVHSEWAKQSVVRDSGINPEKVYVVVPGANIEAELYAQWDREHGQVLKPPLEGRPLKLVFVGRAWQRKGLERAPLSLRVIGCAKESLPNALQRIEGVEWIGLVDKRTDAMRFLTLVSECDIGCQLSRAEAGGIAQREFHALGLGVLSTNVGGAMEHRFHEASVGVDGDISDEGVATVLMKLAAGTNRTAQLIARAQLWRRRALYSETIARLQAVLDPSGVHDFSDKTPVEAMVVGGA